MQRLLTLLAVFGFVSATTLTAEATPRKKTRTEYVVTETHPVTRGVLSTKRLADRAPAVIRYDTLKKVHWVQWKFIGINEPMRYRRFETVGQAQDFINDDGPSKSGKLGFALLTGDTKILQGSVRFTEVVVPVNGGGNGGGNGGNAGEVIDTIDRIIGIIGR